MDIKTCLQNFGTHLEKQHGHHSRLFENHKDALNLEILQLASSICTKDIWLGKLA